MKKDFIREFDPFDNRQGLNNNSQYAMIRQDTTTNALARISSKSKIEKIDFTTTGIIKTRNGNTDLQVIINEYSNKILKQSTSKLLRLLTIEFTKGNNKTISISLKDAMNSLGLRNVDKARTSIKKDLDALFNISCEATKTAGNKKQDFIKFRVLDMYSIKNGTILVNFSDAIYNHLSKCALMPYPKELLRIESNSNKNPYAFYLGDKIYELKKYNQYDTTGLNKKSNIVSIKTLLSVCMSNGMPTYQTVINSDRRVEQRIIKPLEDNLDACSEMGLFKWEYCNSKGVVLSNNQLKTVKYSDFVERYIKFYFPEVYPVGQYDTNRKKNKRT